MTERIGAMRERVDIQTRTPTVGAIGNVAFAWATTATVWAQVRPMSARERFVAERLAARGVYEITIRWRTGITPAMRMLWRGRTFNVKQILNPDERRRFLTIIVEDAAPDAGRT